MSKGKHILVIPSWYPPDGGYFFREHSEALQATGWDVRLLVNRWMGIRRLLQVGLSAIRGFREVKEGPLNVVRTTYLKIPGNERLNIRRWSRQTAAHYARYEKRYGRPDLILAHSVTWAGYAASLIREKHEVPYVLVEHRSFFVYSTPEAQKMVRPFYLPFFHEAYKGCSAAVLVSESMKEGFRQLMPEVLDKVQVIPNMIREDLFTLAGSSSTTQSGTTQSATTQSATTPSAAAEPFTFIWSGRLEAVKGVDVLLEALALLKKKTSARFRVRLAGKGSLRKSLGAQSHELGLEEEVEFLGRLSREDIREAYRQASCFVTPTRYEAFGVVLIEAMASGLPVIATRSGGPEHIVKPETGLLVEKDDPEALAEAMQYMMEHVFSYDPLKVRELTVSSYGTSAVMDSYSKLFEEVIYE